MKVHYPLKAPAASAEKKQQLARHLLQENMQRCKLFAKIVIGFESLLIAINAAAVLASPEKTFTMTFYLFMYTLLLLASCFMLFYITWFEKKEKRTERQWSRFHIGLSSLVSFFIAWGAVVTLGDQQGYGHVMAFAVNFMCVSILYHASTKTVWWLYAPSLMIIAVGLPIYQPSPAVLAGHIINLTVFLFFCYLASRMFYIGNATNFYNKLLLTEMNETLAQKVGENEEINRQLVEANDQLKQLTLIDDLTKIPNRRGFQQHTRDWFRASEDDRKLTLMMLDIDGFKPFNDHYGHLEGDKVIKRVAAALKSHADLTDSFISRFGGEEFIIAVFDRTTEEIGELAEGIRQRVEELRIPHAYSPVADCVTVSIGVSSALIAEEKDIKKLIGIADFALYEAKAQGRNRIIRTLELQSESIT